MMMNYIYRRCQYNRFCLQVRVCSTIGVIFPNIWSMYCTCNISKPLEYVLYLKHSQTLGVCSVPLIFPDPWSMCCTFNISNPLEYVPCLYYFQTFGARTVLAIFPNISSMYYCACKISNRIKYVLDKFPVLMNIYYCIYKLSNHIEYVLYLGNSLVHLFVFSTHYCNLY